MNSTNDAIGNRSRTTTPDGRSVPTIVYVSPGPTYNPRSSYRSPWEALSERYRGYILTTGPDRDSMSIGAFAFDAMRSRNRPIDSLRFFVFCVSRAVSLRLKGEKVDLVTTYDPLKSGLAGLLVARIHGARFAPEVNGVYTSAAVWEDDEDSLMNRIKRRIVPAVMRFVLKRSDAVKVLFAEQLAPFQAILRDKMLRVFPCEVSTSAFVNLGEEKLVLFAGFPFKLKGVDVLIEAFKKLAPRYPDWTLKIVGWFPDPRPLQAAIDGHPQIQQHPPAKRSEMPEHIGRCAILVLPSRSEAMGRVLVEAMAAEKPRIGSNVGGIPTVIRDGVDGYLFESENVDDLAEKLDRLMANPELRRAMGQAGKARIPVEFARDVYLTRLTAFYDEVLAL